MDGLTIIGGILLFSGLSTWLFLSILEEIQGSKKRKQLENDIVAAISHSQPSWSQVLNIAETEGFGIEITHKIIRAIYRDILIGKNKDLQAHRSLLEEYLAIHQKAEPFEGLPNGTRVHLERLHEALAGKEQLLEPLTAQIRELVSVYERENRVQRRYTAWGFFLALVGILFAGYSYFNPYSPPSPSSQQINGGNQPESVKNK